MHAEATRTGSCDNVRNVSVSVRVKIKLRFSFDFLCIFQVCDGVFVISSAYTAFDNHIEPPDHGPPVIRTSTGWVQGTHMKTIKGRDISAFMGIPYAKPPVGDLRFRSPVPLEPWEGFYSAEKPGPVCLQVDATQFYLVMGKEDCLHLSIYTPKVIQC